MVCCGGFPSSQSARPATPTTHAPLPSPLLPLQSGQPKRVVIQQPGVAVVIAQPWAPAKSGWAPWLNVQVTITRPLPAGVKLGGQLGSTLSAAVSGASFTAKSGSVTIVPSSKTLP